MEENKNEIKIIEQEVEIENTSNEFIEPKWMKILRKLSEDNSAKLYKDINFNRELCITNE